MINVADRAFLQLMWFPEFDYFFSTMILLVVTSFWNETSAPPLQTHHGKEYAFTGVWSVRVRSYWSWVWLFRYAVEKQRVLLISECMVCNLNKLLIGQVRGW